MRKILLVILIGFTACSRQNTTSDVASDETVNRVDTFAKAPYEYINPVLDTIHRFDYSVYEKVVSKKVLNILKRTLPGWRLPDPTSYEAIFFNYYKMDYTLINYIYGDFNCDTNQDYAFILENQDTQEVAAWVLYSAGSEHKAARLEILRKGGSNIDTFLELVDRGVKIQDLDGLSDVNKNEIIELKCEAITVGYDGTSSKIYFWNKDKFKYIWAMD